MEINESNFNQYFFPAKNHVPTPNEILVCYSAMADFQAGHDKKQLLKLLTQEGTAISAVQYMKKVIHSSELDSIRVPLAMLRDFSNGMSLAEINSKNYRFKLELLFYTLPEYVPNDPHWTTVSIFRVNHENKVSFA